MRTVRCRIEEAPDDWVHVEEIEERSTDDVDVHLARILTGTDHGIRRCRYAGRRRARGRREIGGAAGSSEVCVRWNSFPASGGIEGVGRGSRSPGRAGSGGGPRTSASRRSRTSSHSRRWPSRQRREHGGAKPGLRRQPAHGVAQIARTVRRSGPAPVASVSFTPLHAPKPASRLPARVPSADSPRALELRRARARDGSEAPRPARRSTLGAAETARASGAQALPAVASMRRRSGGLEDESHGAVSSPPCFGLGLQLVAALRVSS